MKFLMDVNASGILSNFLLELGHDVAFVNRVDTKTIAPFNRDRPCKKNVDAIAFHRTDVSID